MKPLEVSALGGGRIPLDAAIESVVQQEAAGFDAAWWSDHFLHWFPPAIWTPDLVPLAEVLPSPHNFLDPVPIMAAAAMRTEKIRFGTAVTDAIRRHPAVLAQTFITLDHITKGRTMLGIGVGEAENVVPYGLPYERVASRLIEALEIIRLLWSTHEPVDFAGDFWTLDQAILGAPHYGERPPEIWLAAHRPRMLATTGRVADGWLPVASDPADYARMLASVRSAAREAGRVPEDITAGMYVWVVVDEDRPAAERMINSLLLRLVALTAPAEEYERAGTHSPLGEGRWGLLDYVPTRLNREQALAAAAAVPEQVLHNYYFWGTPDDIVERLRGFRAAGLEHAYLVNVTALGDHRKAASSNALLGDVLSGLRALDR
ncbi:MAG TPA: LLM class flavin-dependent oxidoreductase [Miltoncostaeaceae bacterium]|nr:LLM class flavin-dependent oxidoreductase [Miltoncostaeaceae bacterium]